MKKRIRKKRRLGEFREYGFTVIARYPDSGDPDAPPPPHWSERSDALLDEFISFVERRNLGIGGNPEGYGAFVARLCASRRCVACNRMYGRDRPLGSVTEADRQAILDWFTSHGARAVAGPLIDAHHSSEAQFEAATPKLP